MGTGAQEAAREQDSVMLAFADGKQIEYRNKNRTGATWAPSQSPIWDWCTYDYRVAPPMFSIYLLTFDSQGRRHGTSRSSEDSARASMLLLKKVVGGTNFSIIVSHSDGTAVTIYKE